MTNTTMTGADVSALIECHKLAHAQEMAALQAKCDAMEAAVEEAKLMRDNFRCVLKVNCRCDDEFADRQTSGFDSALKAQEAEQAVERS